MYSFKAIEITRKLKIYNKFDHHNHKIAKYRNARVN